VGERLVAAGDARAVHQRALPGAPDAVRNLQRVAVRTDLVAHTFASLDAPGETRPLPPLLAALARGDRRDVPDEQLAVLRRTGTAHLLAISGFHVGLVAWGLASMAARSSRLASLARPRGADTTWLLGAPGLAAALFTLQVGAPVSAQRATLVVCLVAWHRFGGRHLTGGSLLGVAAVVVLVADPAAIGSPSFQLSFGAVAGLVTWGPALERLLPPDLPRWARFLLTGLIASTSTTLGTLPAAAWWFQSTAPVGLVNNLFAIPWTAVLVHLALAAAHLPDPVHLPFVTLGDGAAQLLLHTLALFDVDPWTPATTAAGALCCTSIFLARRPSLAVLGVLFGLALRPLSTELVLTQLDVGQGSATLVSFPDGRHWLIDGGYPGEAVLATSVAAASDASPRWLPPTATSITPGDSAPCSPTSRSGRCSPSPRTAASPWSGAPRHDCGPRATPSRRTTAAWCSRRKAPTACCSRATSPPPWSATWSGSGAPRCCCCPTTGPAARRRRRSSTWWIRRSHW
jgi:ComEC/Rec2-related protein